MSRSHGCWWRVLLRPCAAAAGVGLHVDTTAYVFSFQHLSQIYTVAEKQCRVAWAASLATIIIIVIIIMKMF